MKRADIVIWAAVAAAIVLSFDVFGREPLSFEQRVNAQEAIEKVYYNHRIWPKENKTPKPTFEKMVSKETIEVKVTDYLKKSAALEKYWYRPITAQQLQAEMERMAKGTKDPATLNELFSALDNDPYIITECLARPVLADRLVRNWYANDERFHKETREKAEEALKLLTAENFCSYPQGQYSKMTYRLDAEGRDEMGEPSPEDNDVKLDENEFVSMLTEIPEEGKISEIQENNDRFVIVHSIAKSEAEIEVESLSFQKTGVDEWIRIQELPTQLPNVESANLYLPPMPESGCTEGWDNGIINDIPDGCSFPIAVWTGSEMIIWGGYNYSYSYLNAGARYNPSTDVWTATSTGTDCPSARQGLSGIWTGSRLIIWGGYDGIGYLNTGGMYDPTSNSWTATSRSANCPSERLGHSAVWTGTEMIVWGGSNDGNYFNTGGVYDPDSDTWRETSTGADCPIARDCHKAVWTGSEMVIWAGRNQTEYFNSGGRFNPSTNVWAATSTGANCPAARYMHTAIWTGSKMIVWGGFLSTDPSYTNTGGIYDPSSDTWSATSTGAYCPSIRLKHTAVWTGSEMIIWGGIGNTNSLNTGGRYTPSSDSWAATSTGTNCPVDRLNHVAVWTGSEMIIWGGINDTSHLTLHSGGRYNPMTDSWIATSAGTRPPVRRSHTAVWTGTEMIIWGGYYDGSYLNSGGNYNSATDSWTAISSGLNCPAQRCYHTAIWTGSEMIVWGGYNLGYLKTGANYNPSSNTWTATTSTGTNCPAARAYHTAVWTGSEMIVWGGLAGSYFSSGGKYTPGSDTWTATSTGTGCPVRRRDHTAVWTGSEMVVWGGWGGSSYLNSGGRYNPSSDQWTPTSTETGCPAGRRYHTAVWTGSEMIIWGGDRDVYLNSGGRYNLSTDTWTATSTGTDCPVKRADHTAVWTGNDMIIWGGYNNNYLNTGGKYYPENDTWFSTSTGNDCPIARSKHTAVWTGREMIVWGGNNYYYLSTGGKYYIPYSPSGFLSNSAVDLNGCGDDGVLVEWSAPSIWGDNASGLRTFDIMRDGSCIATGLAESALTYTDTTGDNGVYYLYQVRANNGCGLSTITEGVSVADNGFLGPQGLSNNFAGDNSGCSDSGVLIEWNAPSNWADSGSGTRTFDILRDGSLIGTGLSESTLSYTDTTGENGTSYLYQARANNGCGLSTTTAGVSAADNVGAVLGEVPSFDNMYSWDAVSGADGYRVYRGTLSGLPNLMIFAPDACLRYEGTATSLDTSADDPSSETGRLYWYLVTAYTGSCEGAAGEGTGYTRKLSSSVSCE